MIRTTISRIKRVWAITFSPGFMRGDVRFTPGKFQILSSATQSPPQRRSKSSDSTCKDPPQITKCGGAAGSEEKDVFDDYLSPDMRGNDRMHGAPPLYQTTSACRCDECNNIIAEIFSEETSLRQDNDLKRKLLANIAQINITDNIDTGKFTTDKAQHGLFQRKKKEDGDSLPRLTKVNIDNDSTPKTENKSDPFNELVSMNKTLDEKSKVNVDAHQMYTNLYDVDPEEYQCKFTDDNKKSPYSNKKLKDHNVDAYWKDVYETAVGENSVYCEHTLSIDEDTLNVYKVLKNPDSKLDGTLEYRRLKRSPRELEKMIASEKLFKDSSKREGNKMHATRASIEKQDDDKLIQKVEHIEEAPLVEAEKPKVEGSQIAPRVLGYVGKGKVFNSLDEVAKRCLTSPQNRIDEILLKEMEKLGIPLTVQRTNSCLKIEDTKPDALNKQKKVPQEEEIELDDRDIKNKPEKWGVTGNLHNSAESKEDPLDTVTQFHLDLNRTKMHDDLKSNEKAKLQSDTKTETVCDANTENRCGWLYWRVKNPQQQDPKRSGTSEQEHNTFTDQMWQKNQLDPKHVLTCNETCSISPKPLIHKEVENVEGTEDMYKQQQTNLYMKQKPLLEEGESEPLATSIEEKPQHIIKPDYLNRSKTVDFTNITKDNASTAVDSVAQQTSEAGSTFNITPPELRRREVDLEPMDEPKNTEDLTENTIIQAVDSEQLQLTTEQLQVASEQLQATCEHLQATTEQLQAATTQLQATSNHLCDSSNKLCTASENLNTTTEKLQYTSENLRDSTEQLCSNTMLINKNSNYPKKESDIPEEADHAVKMYEQFIKNTPSDKEQLKIASTETFINDTIKSAMDTPKPSKDLSVNPAAAALISKAVSSYMKDTKTEKTSTQQVERKGADKEKPEKTKDDDETVLKELDNKCFSPNIEGWAQQATTINPSVPMTEDLPPIKPLPEINENTKLSELMRVVRERNRLVDCHEATVLVKPKKFVPPLAKPLANPSNYQMPSIPEVKSIPRVCVPKKSRPTKKCSYCNLETLGLDQNTSFIGRNKSQEWLDVVSLDQHQAIDLTLAEDDLVTDFADDFILQLHYLSDIIESSYKRGKAKVLETAVLENRHLAKIVRSQDYEPWSPIPSWPYPKKPKKQKLQCPKDGCQIPPPLSVEERPCGLKPFRNEESPILSRTFFKTDWPKPKYIDKPYVDTRREDKHSAANISPTKPPSRSKKPTTPINVLPKVKKSIYKDTIRNNMTGQITHLNLERLLLPTMASVFYEIERYHTDNATSKINMTDTDSKLFTENTGKSMVDDYSGHETMLKKARYLLLTVNDEYKLTGNRERENLDNEKPN
ncbi:unnamed protein product [Arctia plantaginis]|uniref:Uncharacterized protein n=1 Tax=Arctia plantaginis TaxID=874455 RepID=A0A8S1BEM8_ARCPL|nr:unnamed protein product [Arctia plantaginis]